MQTAGARIGKANPHNHCRTIPPALCASVGLLVCFHEYTGQISTKTQKNKLRGQGVTPLLFRVDTDEGVHQQIFDWRRTDFGIRLYSLHASRFISLALSREGESKINLDSTGFLYMFIYCKSICNCFHSSYYSFIQLLRNSVS